MTKKKPAKKTAKKRKAPHVAVVALELDTQWSIASLKRLFRRGRRYVFGHVKQAQVNVIKKK